MAVVCESRIVSACQLLALAKGVLCEGDERCFYCGAPCGQDYNRRQFVKDTFTGLDGVLLPASSYVCPGCVIALDERATITLLDGEVRTSQKTRCYSWVITPDAAVAATKAHLDRLRAICLDPPPPPFVVVLSDSGQKHLLYRGVVCRDVDETVVALEGERVRYTRAALIERLALAGKLISATGKPALSEPVKSGFVFRVSERFRDAARLIGAWERVRQEPLSRLAVWLSPPKEKCQIEYPSDVEL